MGKRPLLVAAAALLLRQLANGQEVEGAPDTMSAGSEHSCFVLTQGRLTCFGHAQLGRLGSGDGKEDLGDTPGELGEGLHTIDLGSGRSAKAVSAGLDHTCAITSSDDLVCFGRGAYGQLGFPLPDPTLCRPRSLNLGDHACQMGEAIRLVDLGAGRKVKSHDQSHPAA